MGNHNPVILCLYYAEGSIKDVTHRYDSKWMIGTQKLRVESDWWQQTLLPFRTRNEVRDREEDDQLEGKH